MVLPPPGGVRLRSVTDPIPKPTFPCANQEVAATRGTSSRLMERLCLLLRANILTRHRVHRRLESRSVVSRVCLTMRRTTEMLQEQGLLHDECQCRPRPAEGKLVPRQHRAVACLLLVA